MFSFFRFLRRRSVGIVGLPNIGKSTLFNALTGTSLANVGNFPFCTINANVGKAVLPDDRVRQLAEFTKAPKKILLDVEVVDVAGLIEGAHNGKGLGNQFLADVRRCTVLLHVIRCFESLRDGFGAASPLKDLRTIHEELLLADYAVIEKRLARAQRTGDAAEAEFLQRVQSWLEAKGPLFGRVEAAFHAADRAQLHALGLLCVKPILYVLNVGEDSMGGGSCAAAESVEAAVATPTEERATSASSFAQCVRICASIEAECAQCDPSDRAPFLALYGRTTRASDVILRHAHALLNLVSFFTAGTTMVHAWAAPRGATVRDAAGAIHSDFRTHFVAAKVARWNEMISSSNLTVAEQRMRRVDGNATIEDGDVIVVEHRADRR